MTKKYTSETRTNDNNKTMKIKNKEKKKQILFFYQIGYVPWPEDNE